VWAPRSDASKRNKDLVSRGHGFMVERATAGGVSSNVLLRRGHGVPAARSGAIICRRLCVGRPRVETAGKLILAPTITGWTTGGINAGWNWLTSDASPVQVAVPRPIPDSPQPAGSTVSPSAAKAPATGNGVGSPSPRPDGRLSIANANFEVSEVLGQGGCQLQAAAHRRRLAGSRPVVKDNDAADP